MAATTNPWILTKRLSSFYSIFHYHYTARLGYTCIRQASYYPHKPLTPLEKSLKELKKTRNPLTGDKRPGRDFNYNMELSALAKRLGHTLKTLPLLQTALIHESAVEMLKQETTPTQEIDHNSDLVSLGECLLNFYCRKYLIDTYPNLRPYMVTGIVQHLLSLENLNKLSRYLGVANLLVTSQEPSEQVFADTLVAVFGAVQKDIGSQAISKLTKDFVLLNVQDVELKNTLQFKLPRLMLQDLMRRQGRGWPVPRLIKETGRLTHFPTFVVGFYVNELLIGEGAGTSLKRAQNEAASAALRDHFLSRARSNIKKRHLAYNNKRNDQSSSLNNSDLLKQSSSRSTTDSQIMTG